MSITSNEILTNVVIGDDINLPTNRTSFVCTDNKDKFNALRISLINAAIEHRPLSCIAARNEVLKTICSALINSINLNERDVND